MRWQGREQSENVEDRRGLPVSGGVAIGGGLGMIILAIVLSLLGVDPRGLLDMGNPNAAVDQGQVDPQAEKTILAQKPLEEMSRVVLKDTEDVWKRLSPELGRLAGKPNFRYQEPVLVFFSNRVESACGMATSAVGPFYCPGDQKVYLDLAFFDELQRRFKAPGDFAMAYVIAHEVGHHVQNQLGLTAQVQQRQSRLSKAEGNQWSVRLELQADYLSGVWAYHNQKMKQFLESGDIAEALNAATRIGDDVLQSEATGVVRPDAFTHGTAEQRARWLKAGLKSGSLDDMMAPFELEYDEL